MQTPPKFFDLREVIFNEVAPFISIGIVVALYFTVGFRGDGGCCTT